MPRRHAVAAAAALAAATLAVSAPAAGTRAAPLTATAIRIGDHPAAVRAVVDFTGGEVLAGEVVASDPNPFLDGRVRLPLTHPGVRTTAAPVTAAGVTAGIARDGGSIVIALDGAPRRFKYAGYRALHDPERLAIDLFESAPPAPAAEIRRAPGGCLALRRVRVKQRRVIVRGRERNLFENSLVVRLRARDGSVVRQRAVTAAAGRWRAEFRYPRLSRQRGTLEAVALSAKDGTLDCLAQVGVRIGVRG